MIKKEFEKKSWEMPTIKILKFKQTLGGATPAAAEGSTYFGVEGNAS